jgi:DNA repair exonuclease SbcCD ATPase subunit
MMSIFSKKIKTVILLFFIAVFNSEAQQLTFDFENLLQSIKEYEVMMQQTQMMITSLQYQYETTMNQAKQLQQLDYSDIHSFRDAVSMANEGLTFLRNTENYLTKKRFKFGNNSYTLTEMYQAPGGALSTMVVAATKKMSESEKARIWAYYGLDPANYYYSQVWKKRIQTIGKELTALAGQSEDLAEKQMQANDELADKAKEVDSQVALQQISVELLKNVANNLAMLGLGTSKIGEQMAAITELKNYEPMVKPAVSDDFMKSLNSK